MCETATINGNESHSLINKLFKTQLIKKYGKVARIHLGPRPNVIIASPEGFEKVLSSNKQITKVCLHVQILIWKEISR